VPANIVAAAFRTAKGGAGQTPGAGGTEWLVFRVTDIKTPALDLNSAGAKATAQTVERQMADDVIGQYMAWLETYLGTNINGAALAQAIGNSSNGPLGQN